MELRGANGRRALRAAAGKLIHFTIAALTLALVTFTLVAAAQAAGSEMFSTSSFSTGEKPQSKLWYHDGSYWGALKGPDGVALYKLVGSTWERGPVLASGGYADVKWNGSELLVLLYSSSSKFYKYTYGGGAWSLVSGFPVSVPTPSGSETMVMDQDSSGRVWATAEGGGNVNVYYTTSADHKSWTGPIVLRSGVGSDDITSVIAFGGNKIGVFWSDQNRDEFGFCVHQDSDSPTSWGSVEVVWPGSGNADDHINLARDSSGRVYAITKDDRDEFAVHRRGASGGWTTKTNIAGGDGTRPILLIAEADNKAYALYTRWGSSPNTIQYRVADLSSLSFGGQVTFISSSSSMNNVTGMKQSLPAGSLIAVAENGSKCLYNSFGSPPSGGPQPPGAPQNLTATLFGGPTRTELAWSAPSGNAPSGYNVYRSVSGGSPAKLNGAAIAGTTYTDNSPASGQLCYQVRAVGSGLEGSASNTACVDNTPAVPPGAPQNLVASFVDPGLVSASLLLPFDEGNGQATSDLSGNGNDGRLGTGTGSDSSDPVWVSGITGSALQFDGANDFVEIPHAASLDMPSSFTVEAWVRWNGGTGTIVNKGASNGRNYRIKVTSSGVIEFLWEISGGSNRETTTSALFNDSNWHHVACVYDQAAGQNRIFLDGQLRASGGASGTPVSNTKTVLVGSGLSTSSRRELWNGAIDQLRITPNALYSTSFVPPTLPGILPEGAVAARTASDAPTAQVVQLSWQAPSGGAAVSGYDVQRSANSGAFVSINTALVAATSYTDANPVEGNLCYRVFAVGATGLASLASNTACVDAGAPPPPPPGAPFGLTVALQGTSPEAARVAWEAPVSGGTPSGYNVYRSIDGGAFAKVNAGLVGSTSFIDANLVNGNLCYRVAGVDAQSQEGALSNSDCVTYSAPPPPPPGAPLNVLAILGSTPGGASGGAAAYPLDEGSGQIFADATANGHDGVVGATSAAESTDPTWGTGLAGAALVFDGANDRALVADAPGLRFAGSFTVEAWVQRGGTGNPDCILSKGDSQQRNFWMLITSSGMVDFRWESAGGSNHGTTSPALVTDSAWHHVACVYDQVAGQNRIYLDGVLVKQGSDSGTPVTSEDPLYFGARLSSGSLKDYFVGSIDLVRLSGEAIYTGDFTPPTAYGGGLPQEIVTVTWDAPAAGTVAGYNVYRKVGSGAFTKLNGSLVTSTLHVDTAPPNGALCYQVKAVDGTAQEGTASASSCLDHSITKVDGGAMRESLVLGRPLAASPNPFNPATTIDFRLPAPAEVHLAIYNVRGERVAWLARGPHVAGVHSVRWAGRDDHGSTVASGTYFVLLQAGAVQEKAKLVLLK